MNLAESRLVYPRVQGENFIVRWTSKILSALYGSAVFIRNEMYSSGLKAGHLLPGKVISVGNVAVGGTGKTPVVMEIATYLQRRGARPVILTRGYGSGLEKRQWILMLAGNIAGGNLKSATMPDEGRLQSVQCPDVPVVAGPARFYAASEYVKNLKSGNIPTHWILDDGFQHRQISRDFDIVLLDKENAFGNKWLLPFGFLREPVSSLRRASHLLLTGDIDRKQQTEKDLQDLFPDKSIFVSTNVSTAPAEDVLQKVFFNADIHLPALLVAGIARPERLRRDLKNAGILCVDELILPDHGAIDFKEIDRRAQQVRSVVTTAKDYWRNPEAFQSLKIPVFVKKLRIELPESLLAALY